MTIHITEAVARIRDALKRRVGEQRFSVTREYEVAEPRVTIHARASNRSAEGAMSLDDRRTLANLLDIKLRTVKANDGLVIEFADVAAYVGKAERGIEV